MGNDEQKALLFPAFKSISIETPWQDHIRDLASYIISSPSKDPIALSTHPIQFPTILVCTHGGRDKRCGVLGPLLVKEFEQQSQAKFNMVRTDPDRAFDPSAINVGGVSHVGGHKWAGNVIIYIPPNYEIKDEDGSDTVSPLAGKGIWYGRVEPSHVDGILNGTIQGGRVIRELFRGGIDHHGNPLRI